MSNFSNPDILAYYLIFIVLLALSTLTALAKSHTLDRFLIIPIFAVSIAFYTLSENYSPDMPMYIHQFKTLGSFENFSWGYSFYILMRFLSIFDHSESFYVASSVSFLLASTLLAISLYISAPAKSFCLTLYILNFSYFEFATNVYRQGVAASFIIIASYYLINKRYLAFSVSAFIAIGFHWSAITILIVILLSLIISRSKRSTMQLCAGALCLNITVILLSKGFLGGLSGLDFLNPIFKLVNIDFQNKLDAYVGNGVEGALFNGLSLLGRIKSLTDISIVLLGATLFVYNITTNTQIDRTQKISLFLVCITASLSIYNALLIDMAWFIRNLYWAFSFTPILITHLISKGSYHSSKAHKNILVTTSIIYLAFSSLTLWRSTNLELYNIQFPL